MTFNDLERRDAMGLGFFSNIRLYRLMNSDHIRDGNQRGEGRFVMGQPRPDPKRRSSGLPNFGVPL